MIFSLGAASTAQPDIVKKNARPEKGVSRLTSNGGIKGVDGALGEPLYHILIKGSVVANAKGVDGTVSLRIAAGIILPSWSSQSRCLLLVVLQRIHTHVPRAVRT